MSYKWKPNTSQRREFAQKMSDPQEKAAYYAAKEAKAEKRRSNSQFDYNSAGGLYIPTKTQHDAAFKFMSIAPMEANSVIYGYTCQEKIPHDHIHVINELIRKQA